MMAFLNGAGSIRAYPHAENTGLVISDVAKIGSFSEISKFSANFFTSLALSLTRQMIFHHP